jgi:hypothetical protein
MAIHRNLQGIIIAARRNTTLMTAAVAITLAVGFMIVVVADFMAAAISSR